MPRLDMLCMIALITDFCLPTIIETFVGGSYDLSAQRHGQYGGVQDLHKLFVFFNVLIMFFFIRVGL